MSVEDKESTTLRLLQIKEIEVEKLKIHQYSMIREVNDQALTQQIQHKRRLSQLVDEHEAKLSNLKTILTSEIEQQKKVHAEVITSLTEEISNHQMTAEKQLDEQAKSYGKIIAAMNAKLRQETGATKDKYSEYDREIKDYQSKIVLLLKNHSDTTNELKIATAAQVEKQMFELRQNHETVVRKLNDAHNVRLREIEESQVDIERINAGEILGLKEKLANMQKLQQQTEKLHEKARKKLQDAIQQEVGGFEIAFREGAASAFPEVAKLTPANACGPTPARRTRADHGAGSSGGRGSGAGSEC